MIVAAIVPVYNRKPLTLACIAQLEAQRLEGFQLRIIIVDDGSTDGTGEAIRSAHPEVEVVRTEGNCWWTRSVNIGIKRARELGCDAVYLTNDDIFFNPDCLMELVRGARRHGPQALVGSAVLNAHTGRLILAGYRIGGLFDEPRGMHSGQSLAELGPEDIPSVLLPGKSLLFPVALLDAIGPLDERHFPHNFGDFEFTTRATNRGFFCVVCPASVVTSDVNPNYLALKIVESTRLGFLKCLFQRRYGFNIRDMLALSLFMHRPSGQAALLFLVQSARIVKHVLCKLLLPKSTLRSLYSCVTFATRTEPGPPGDPS